MDAIDAQELMLPILTPAEFWHQSGRWNDYGPELMRISDRHDREFCLGPTHEETFTDLVRNELRSYKQLPVTLYQIQDKFRDEARPRFGLLRGREFIMKDAYSFHADHESLQKTYEDMNGAYARVCERCGIDYAAVEADSGQIGGKVTTEFMALAEAATLPTSRPPRPAPISRCARPLPARRSSRLAAAPSRTSPRSSRFPPTRRSRPLPSLPKTARAGSCSCPVTTRSTSAPSSTASASGA